MSGNAEPGPRSTARAVPAAREPSPGRVAMGLVRACHPAPALTVSAITASLAAASGRGWGVMAVAAAVLAGQLAVGWSNDYLDRERDARVGRQSKPIVSGDVSGPTVAYAAGVAFALCVGFSLLSGALAAAVHLAAVALALAYNAGLKGTVASPLPYAFAFAALPAFVTLGAPGSPWPPLWAPIAGAAFGVGAHMVNTLDDLADDRRVGVLGLPQRLGERRALTVGVAALVAAVAVLTFAPPGGPGAGGLAMLGVSILAVAAVVVAARTGHSEAAWRLSLLLAGLSVGLLILNGAQLT